MKPAPDLIHAEFLENHLFLGLGLLSLGWLLA